MTFCLPERLQTIFNLLIINVKYIVEDTKIASSVRKHRFMWRNNAEKSVLQIHLKKQLSKSFFKIHQFYFQKHYGLNDANDKAVYVLSIQL